MSNNQVRSEDSPVYQVEQDSDDLVIAQALSILARRCQPGAAMTSPTDVKNYLVMRAAHLEREVFGCMWLDSQNRIIKCEDLFAGTLTQTSVYPREVVKQGIQLSAAAVIFTHNHPSGIPSPSRADEALTQTLKAALALVDIRVLDHIITAAAATTSMAEMGMI